MVKTVFGTVVHERAWKWNSGYIEAINNQSADNFDVLIINDGLSEKKVQELKDRINKNLIVVTAKEGASISENRKQLIFEAHKRKYQLLVFGDFDDIFSDNRVAEIQKAYRDDIGFYYNCIKSFEYKNIFLDIPLKTDSIFQILEENYLGLSNTAINLSSINDRFISSLDNIETNVFDWYLFSRLLLDGAEGIRVDECASFYRIHSDNIVGILNKDEALIKLEIQVKLEQYKKLVLYFPKLEKLINQYKSMEDCKVEEILDKFKNPLSYGYWWSNLKVHGGVENV